MIELYGRGTTDFTNHGIALAAQSADVSFQDNGQYDLDVVMPYNAAIAIDYGMILRCPVPKQHVGAITLGTVEYWEISDGLTDVPLYKTVPVTTTVGYKNWEFGIEYEQGDKVTYDKKNYRADTAISGPLTMSPPPVLPNNWTEIARTKTTGGEVLAQLDAGDQVVKTGDYNSTYMKAADTAGHEGFIQISKCTDLSESETKVIPAQDIVTQSFTITEIRKSTDGKTLSIHAEHISYELGKVIIGDCSISRATPATALLFLQGAMQSEYPGNIYTNMTGEDALITADFSWKNAQNAILDPKGGFLQATPGHLFRNDLDVYLLAEEEANPRYRISYGVNMKAVKWTGDAGDLVTRIYPIAQNEDGSTLLLPEQYIDSARTVPFIRPEVLNTGLKVGTKEKQEDGSEIVLDIDTVYARMREKANNRFNIDECDKVEITLEVDWEHLPDTAEYAQYAALQNAAPGDWAQVLAGPLGINENIQLTGYTFDAILLRYKKGTFGKKKVSSSVPGYAIQSGAVNSRALAAGAVGSQNIQAGSITAREIEANSITAEQIASKVINTELLQAGAVTADEIAAGSITTVKLAAQAITAEKIAAGAITAAAIGANTIQAEHIMSGAVTTDKLAAGSVEASKIAALAITTDKLAANAVTTDKLAAGSVTADQITTDQLAAVQAKLQIANIANAQIASADISYAKVKDLVAGTAIFDTTITEQGIADRLFINRLLITYGQMVEATIGDLVIGASDGNYYHIDVEWDEDGVPTLVPTQVETPSAAEIAAGHTTGGQTIIGNIGTFAELSTEDFYAINSIIDRITARRIDVDYLWAREAFIGKLMLQDLSSNTYIQSTIGTWQSGSTITQTIDSLDSRISSLGYGTVYMQPDEPDHSHLVSGDIWIQTLSTGSWQDIYNSYSSWGTILNGDSQATPPVPAVSSWQVLGAIPKMWVWDGQRFQEMYDALLPTTLQTEIEQLSTAITLRATKEEVDLLSEDVTEFAATLVIQAEEIESALSAVNLKAASYVMWEDPRTEYTPSVGDIWVKRDEDFCNNSTWNDVYNNFASWNALKTKHDAWADMLGDKSYVWNGSAWIETSDRGAEINQRTIIDQTSASVTILAERTAEIGDEVYRTSAALVVANDRITAEVERATNAENGKIAKTTQLQTADQIVSEAVSQSSSAASGLYVTKTTSLQTADQIVTEAVRQASSAASGAYIAKTSSYQTADSIKNEAVRVAGVNASAAYIAKTNSYSTVDQIISQAEALADAAADTAKNASIAKTSTYQSAQAIVNTAVAQAATAAGQTYIAKTSTYQTADSIVSTAESYTDTKLTGYATRTQTSTMISDYVTDNAYGKVSGITITSSGVDISGSQYVKIASGGYFQVTTGDFGIDTNVASSGYCIWAGASTAANSYFRVKKNGEVTLTKLKALAEDGTTETDVNLRTANLWKLNYGTIKALTTSGGYVTSMTLSNAVSGSQTVNFKPAATARAEGWAAAYGKVSWPGYNVSTDNMTVKAPAATETTTGGEQSTTYKLVVDDANASIHIGTSGGVEVARVANTGTAHGRTAGWTAAYNKVSLPGYNISSDSMTVTTPSASETTTGGEQSVTYKVVCDDDYASVHIGTSGGVEVARTANGAKATGWNAARDGSQSIRSGADIAVKIPGTNYGNFSNYNYSITVDTSWPDPMHIQAVAKINGITVATKTVRANQPTT